MIYMRKAAVWVVFLFWFYVYSRPEDNYPVYIPFDRLSERRLKSEHIENIFYLFLTPP